MQKNYSFLPVLLFCLKVSALSGQVDGYSGATQIIVDLPPLQVDALTCASPTYYDSLADSILFEIMLKSTEAHVLSTTNPDGTPNAAYMEPNIASDSVLYFYIDPKAQTYKNIAERNFAYFSFYERVEGGKTWKDRYRGGRMVLRKIDDTQRIETIIKEKKIKNDDGYGILFLDIVRIIPFS